MLIFKSALVTATVHQFQKLRLVLCMVFNQKFEFCVVNSFTLLFRNSIFLHSEARLSSIIQNWRKLLSFHYCLPKGVTNFQCCILNLYTLNYHNNQSGQKLQFFGSSLFDFCYYTINNILEFILQMFPFLEFLFSRDFYQVFGDNFGLGSKSLMFAPLSSQIWEIFPTVLVDRHEKTDFSVQQLFWLWPVLDPSDLKK